MSASNKLITPFTNAAIIRNFAEYALIAIVWVVVQALISKSQLAPGLLILIVILLSLSKTVFFGMENLQQLLCASRDNLAYHRFMMLMLINMSQITLSFGLDYHCLHTINSGSFSGIDPTETMAEQIFDFTYFSTLNFTFFGYGDITPQTIPAKILTITEIVLAFVTVIFLLSDFISMKESIRSKPG
ncbi:MAG: potassium channel family protein [Pirellulaceae bacterium]|nr:potassium channel family protein [Pirellulaceae bacterium]